MAAGERDPKTKMSAKDDAASADAASRAAPRPHRPTCVIVLGMAGSGKTTLMRRLNAYSREHALRPYIINMDPAVKEVPYEPNIDIRDTVDYKEVMKQYSLGPNGGIMTSLNLFTTKIDEVMGLLEKRAPDVDFIFADTPGQIEVFTWSASGSIISQTLATSFPTVLLYVVDTPRTTNCTTFMSNMLYACSILYKMKLPFVIAFNKIDIADHTFAQSWMEDFETFQEAMDAQPQSQQTFYSSLIRSMSLVLEEFYANMRNVGVSAMTGQGMVKLFAAIGEASEEYYESYLPELEKRMGEVQAQAKVVQSAAAELKKKRDGGGGGAGAGVAGAAAAPAAAATTAMMGPGSHNAPGTAVLATDAEREELRQFKELMGQVKGKGSKEAAVAIARGVKVAANEKAKVAATEAAAKKDAETATQQEAMDGLDAQAL
jgi:GTPase SAR1 family protein